MRHRGRLAAAVLAVGLVAGGGAAFAAAHAGVSPQVEWTQKGAGAVAGVFAHAPNGDVDFTHISSYVGNDGGSNQEQLDAATAPSFPDNVYGAPFDFGPSVVNGVGIGMCSQQTRDGVELGEVYIGGNLVDIVFATGKFDSPATNNGDVCQNGAVSPDATILMPNVPVNDTVQLDILYDASHAYTFHGRHHSAGTITFSGTDLSATPGTTVQYSVRAHHGDQFTEADAGGIADTTQVNPLSGVVPFPDVKNGPNLLATFAHVFLNGNFADGSGEVKGSIQSNADWNAFYVAATKNGGPASIGNPVYLGPSKFFDDHFRVYVGQPVG